MGSRKVLSAKMEVAPLVADPSQCSSTPMPIPDMQNGCNMDKEEDQWVNELVMN